MKQEELQKILDTHKKMDKWRRWWCKSRPERGRPERSRPGLFLLAIVVWRSCGQGVQAYCRAIGIPLLQAGL